MNSIVVCSKRKYALTVPEGYSMVSIDRSNPILGNPFVLKNVNDTRERASVIDNYKNWLMGKLEEPKVKEALGQLAERVNSGERIALMCWCAPKHCHGHFLQELIAERALGLNSAAHSNGPVF